MINKALRNTTEVNLFKEEGTNLVNLKRIISENKDNPLVYDTLVANLKNMKLTPVISSAITDESIGIDEFSGLVMTNKKFINDEIVEKLREDFRKKLSNEVEKKGNKFFITEIGENGLPTVIRKFGFSVKFAMREFRLTYEEAQALMEPGKFMEQYATLKLNSIFKDMVEKVKTHFEKKDLNKNFKFDVSKVYYNEEKSIYDVDFKIQVILSEALLKNNNSILIRSYATTISDILSFVEKEYFKYTNNKNE